MMMTRDGKTPETALDAIVEVQMTTTEYEHVQDLLEREKYTFCAFCGGRFPGEGTTDDLKAHMLVCEHHPMVEQRQTIEALEKEANSYKKVLEANQREFAKVQHLLDTHDSIKTKLEIKIQELRSANQAQATRIRELEEWQKIVIGSGTDQETVIRMAASEYTKTAVQCWKDKVAELEAELARVKGCFAVDEDSHL